MPTAVTTPGEVVHKELKSLPEGFVDLQRMTYGQVVQRRALSKLSVMQNKGSNKSITGEMAMASSEISLFEFSHCIVDHNLEDLDGRKLNLGTKGDFDKLDPRVGQEIEDLIAEMNSFDEEDQGE